MVKNRDHWTITDIHRDRSVTVTGRTGTLQLPAGPGDENEVDERIRRISPTD